MKNNILISLIFLFGNIGIFAQNNFEVKNENGSEDNEFFKKYWPADVHLIGKDILRFHTIYWPIMLMALEVELPKQVFGHGWLLVDGGKMSKSKGNVVDPVVLVDHFGVDAVRYFLLREIPFGSDGLFNNETFIKKINSDLANDLGNLLSRSVSMVDKYFEGVIPEKNIQGEFDEDLIALCEKTPKLVSEAIDGLKIPEALSHIWTLIGRSNKYIDETTPWILARDEELKGRLGGVLYNLIEVLRIVSALVEPFLPTTAKKIREQISAEDISFESLENFGVTKSGIKVNKGEIIFPRIDVEKKLEELSALQEAVKPKKEIKPLKEEISIEDFSKLDFRVVKVLECEPMKGAKKLLKLKVDLGNEIRQVISGIAEHYDPKDVIGKKVILVANLKSAKLRGEVSQGMILAAATKDTLSLVGLDQDMEEGTVVS